ncbi:ferric reductase like transmembrane component-domain-containing protein [Butyriboletus roseoflavus]|nr:ferric reductase like transmembrane component-domain-containing protein [Butyriboletus roseoflavus]
MPTISTRSASSKVDPISLVYHVDIFLLIVILVFAVFNAPRAITRFAHRSEWLQGHFLRSTTMTRKPRINLNTNSIYLHSNPQKAALDLDDDSSDATHSQSVPYLTSQSTYNEKALPSRPLTVVLPASIQQTWHMPMLSSLIHPVASLLHRRVHENYSLGQVLLMTGYAVVILYAGLYKSSPFVDFDRSGWVTASQLPFIYILAAKNNVIGMLVGVGYEKLNYLHRLVGRFVVLAANVHAIGYIYKWSIAGNLSQNISAPTIKWGLVALVCFDMLGIFSLHFVRSRSYNLFFITHAVASIVLLFSVCNHSPNCIPYVVVACVFYGLDHLVRAIKTRITTATLRPIPELGLTRVEIPSINAGWRAGQHIRLRVLSTTMGLWSLAEIHPFTIANVSKTDEGLVLLCKKAGRWTTKMYEIANTSVYGEQGLELGRSIKVMVEGPYGGVGNTLMPSYSGIMLVVGGSGVSFALSAVQELVQSGNASNVTDIDVIWCIADPASLTPIIPLLTAFISQCNAARLRFSVFYTRASAKSLDGMYLPPCITLVPGRPKMIKHLDAIVNSVLRGGGCSGVFVGVCGPVSLAGSVSETVRCFDPQLKRAVGGVEFHEEVFGW